MLKQMNDVVVIGGGLAGLVSAIQLARNGFSVVLIEKKKYPFHRVCGEYISNEVVPYLRSLDLYPDTLGPAHISKLLLSSISGKSVELPLTLGGFGISRYIYDQFLEGKALATGVKFVSDSVVSVNYESSGFSISLKGGSESLSGKIVVGAYGKRSTLDKVMKRPFFFRKSPYVGVKYHIRQETPTDAVELHNFSGGYCGLNRIEEGKSNLCYLTKRSNVKAYGSLVDMERELLCKNPFLKNIYENSEMLFKQPEVINEVSFETKSPVHNHVLMCGDAAGMIAPLCGNGMALAIHSAKILAEEITTALKTGRTQDELENVYSQRWNKQFKNRLWIGRKIQHLFGSGRGSSLTVGMARIKPISKYLISKTHGKPF